MEKDHLSTSLRYNSDIANNFLRMLAQAGITDKNTIMKAIMYISKNFQTKFLNEGYFDPVEFCKECNVDLDYLQHPVESPYQFQISDKLEGKEKVGDDGFVVNKQFNTRLENILYLFAKFNLTFTQEDNGRKKTKSVQILKSIKAFKEGKKTRYYIEISDDFRNCMIRCFLSVNMESYIALCDSSADELYLQICSLKSALKYKGVTYTTPENTIPFSILCRLAGISKVSKTGKEYPLKDIKRMLKSKLDAIGSMADMNFDTEWHRTDDPQEPYIVCFLFRDSSAFNHYAVNVENSCMINRVVNEAIIRSMAIIYRKIYKTDSFSKITEADVLDWLYDNNVDEEEKFNAFSRAYIEIGESHKIPDNIKELFEEFRSCMHRKTPIDKISLSKPVFQQNQ